MENRLPPPQTAISALLYIDRRSRLPFIPPRTQPPKWASTVGPEPPVASTSGSSGGGAGAGSTEAASAQVIRRCTRERRAKIDKPSRGLHMVVGARAVLTHRRLLRGRGPGRTRLRARLGSISFQVDRGAAGLWRATRGCAGRHRRRRRRRRRRIRRRGRRRQRLQ
jgi:hypothetical protein